MSSRRRARELALQFLYQVDLIGEERLERLEAFLDEEGGDVDRDFASGLVRGVVAHRDALDAAIAEAASNWDLPRMAVVDRNVLRLGLYELRHRDDVPPKVAIDEAVELGKTFSTQGSGAFVNGILDALYRQSTVEQD